MISRYAKLAPPLPVLFYFHVEINFVLTSADHLAIWALRLAGCLFGSCVPTMSNWSSTSGEDVPVPPLTKCTAVKDFLGKLYLTS